MPSPSERLEMRRQLADCRVCAWLSTLDEKSRKEWQEAILNPRYSAGLVAAEIAVDVAADYSGPTIGESSIDTHRRKAHR